MKILFIYPNAGSQLGFNYGVSHISASLKQAGHSVELWQLCEDLALLPGKDEFTAALRKSNPDVIGFSVVTNQWNYAAKLAKWAAEATDAPLVCGGTHATVAPEEVLNSGLFDFIMVGECDDAFLEFVSRLEKNKSLDDSPNLGCMRGGKPVVNPVMPLPDLARLPFKDYEIFDFQKMIDAKNGWVGLMASRGCPFSCSYCFNHYMTKRYRTDLKCSFKNLNYIRHFPVRQVIDEIKFLLENYRGITMFIFDDDLFTYDSDYVAEFCEEYRRITSLPFVVNAHFGFFDEARALALKKAGCRIVKFGIESGSPRIRDKIMNRHMSNDRIAETISIVNAAGMHSSVFIMIGLPFEGKSEVMETVELLSKARPGRFRWTFFFPYPGTEAHRLGVEGGYVNYEKMKSLSNFTDESCLDFGEEHNLFLEKVGKIMPWYVNAASDFESSSVYREKVDWINKMNREEWKKAAPSILAEDKKTSLALQKKNLTHYAVKYNPFMGVISDYFVNEK